MEVEVVHRKAGLNDDDCQEIGGALGQKGCSTQRVDLSHNTGIGDVGVFYIARGLLANKSVTELSLDSVRLTDRGLDVLAKALEKNQTLRSLSIKGTLVTAAGVDGFSRSLQLHNATLQHASVPPHLPRVTGLARSTVQPLHLKHAEGTVTWVPLNLTKNPLPPM